jgi:Ni/Fe-hydrogenase subunit HybB-like protein
MSSPDSTVPAPGDPLVRYPLIEGKHSDASHTESLLRYLHSRPGVVWWSLVGLCLALCLLLLVATTVTFVVGVGTWGNNIPVGWALGITHFVWWIGIGHAGTLISAILLLFGQRWRSSINRFAETMTIFAVLCAGLYPILHLGRPWKFYWLVPYPSITNAWPQFRSPLAWDIAAVFTYLTVSVLFWYTGLMPDLATARDTAKRPIVRKIFGVLAMGWRGSAKHWHHWRKAYLLLAGISTPLVLSVHSIVSFDFAVSQLPGWHSTIFPPYFVAGAVFSGFALVLTLLLPVRKALHLEHVVTKAHLDLMARVMLAMGLMVGFGYLQEMFFAWYSGDEFELHVAWYRAFGGFAPVFWLLIFCNVVAPQVFWSPKARTNTLILWVTSILINVGMWLERFMIIVSPLEQDFLPSSWHTYSPTWVDISLFLGTMGFFGLGFLLATKALPIIPISEVKSLQRELEEAELFHEKSIGKTPTGVAP